MKPSWMRKLAKSLFGFSKKNNNRRPIFSRSIDLEQLENRLTPTNISSDGNGLIIIIGNDTLGPRIDDNLTLILANNQLTVTDTGTGLTGAVFGVPVVNNTITINFATSTDNEILKFSGIKVNLLDGKDVLNITTGLNLTTLPAKYTQPMTIDFNGDGQGLGLTDNNTFNYQGTVSSKTGNVNINNFTNINTVTNTTGTAFLRASSGNLTVSNDNTGNPINLTGTNLTIADMSWEASSNGTSITINNTLNINTNFGLDIRATGPTDQVNIISKSNTATPLVNSITNKGAGTNNVRVSTQGTIYFEGKIDTSSSFVVLDTGNFTALADVSSGSISVTSNLGSNTTKITFKQNVTTTLGDFTITNLGKIKTTGAQFYINEDALALTPLTNLTFNVARDFSALTTGGVYDLFICGQTATVGANITIANKEGNLTLGTVNIP
jgi:hypothetical protein